MQEEKLIERYWGMYLAMSEMMIKGEIENISFDEFLEKNRPKVVEIKETTETNAEILSKINEIDFN